MGFKSSIRIQESTMTMTARHASFALAALLCCRLAGAQDRVFFGNLHSHTSYSDGSGTPREAFDHARNVAKLDFLAITEHNHADAAGSDGTSIAATPSLYNGSGSESLIKVAGELTVPGTFVALYGQEFSTISSGNHMNVFDIGEVISVEKGRFDKLLTFAEQHHDSSGQFPILMLNHPKNTFDVRPREYGEDDFGSFENFVKQMGARARLIQMINGPGTVDGQGLASASPDEAAFLKFLNLGFKVAPTADQDNHFRNWGNSTQARTGVIADELTKAKILGALRSRHVFATQDRNLSVIIRVNDHLCGDVISPLPPPGTLAIEYQIADADEPNAEYQIQVFRDAVGGSVASLVNSVSIPSGGGSGEISDVAFSGEPQYFFFKVTQFDEDGREDHAWTAPIWFQNGADTILAAPESVAFPVAMRSLPARLAAPSAGLLPGSAGPSSNLAGRIPDLAATVEAARAANDLVIMTANPNGFVASKGSDLFHLSSACLDAQGISPANLITGTEARSGREPHPDCPRLGRVP
jgi:hypothetical protein